MRNKILGGIGIFVGGCIVVPQLLGATPLTLAPANASAAYAAGYVVGQVITHLSGWALLVVGLYYFFKKPNKSS